MNTELIVKIAEKNLLALDYETDYKIRYHLWLCATAILTMINYKESDIAINGLHKILTDLKTSFSSCAVRYGKSSTKEDYQTVISFVEEKIITFNKVK